MPAAATIRAYDPARDLADLRACFIELQDHEHGMIPAAPTGDEIVDVYIPWMLERLERYSGRLLIAELDDEVAGYVSLFQTVPRGSPDDADETHALVSELCVLERFRGRGVGTALLAAAERLAIEAGATNLRLSVVFDNDGARRLYKRFGFEDITVLMRKPLRDDVLRTA